MSVAVGLRGEMIGAQLGDSSFKGRQERVEQIEKDDRVAAMGDEALNVAKMVAEGADPNLGALTVKDGLLPQEGTEKVDRDVSGQPSRGKMLTPMLHDTLSSRPSICEGLAMVCSTRCVTCEIASPLPTPDNSSTNSSPPRRTTESFSRTHASMRCAIVCSN